MNDHTVVRTLIFFIITFTVYSGITAFTKIINIRTLSSFMFSTDSDMLWQILAVGAGIAIALQVSVSNSQKFYINVTHGQISVKNNINGTLPVEPIMGTRSMTRYTPTLIAVGVTFPTFDYLSSFVMRPERQLVQWPAWEISSAFCFAVAITALCMNAQISRMASPTLEKNSDNSSEN